MTQGRRGSLVGRAIRVYCEPRVLLKLAQRIPCCNVYARADRPQSIMAYAVKEIFYTLQGEGANAGRPAVFLRFTGCNLWTGLERDRHKGPGGCSRYTFSQVQPAICFQRFGVG